MPSPIKVIIEQAEGHQSLGYIAKKPIAETKHEKSDLTSGNGLQMKADRKLHPAFLENPNQYQGADNRKAEHPNHMSEAEIAEAALEAQKIEPKLTPNKEFTNTYTPGPSETPSAAPTLTRS